MWQRPQVFLSYAREDQIVIAKLCRKLSHAGMRPWMDVENIAPGEEWQPAINRAIETSSVFLAFLSPRSTAKAGVLRQEMERARELRARKNSPLRVIPVRIEPCEAPDSLRDLQWIDLYDPDGWDRLIRAIRPQNPLRTHLAIAAAVVTVLMVAGLIWFYERPCDFHSARASKICSSQPMVGATFWRLRPAQDSDPPIARSIIQPPAGNPGPATLMAPVRISPGAQLSSGDRFYVTIECTRAGYLYVVNREQYRDRTGSPELIFPTRRIRGGDNYVEKDALVRLPSAEDQPPFFEVNGGSAAGYRGEIFTVILLTKPLPAFETPADHMNVASAFENWQNAWRRSADLIPNTGQNDRITEAEARAHLAKGEIVQTLADPSPALIYRIAPGIDGGLWVDFRLPVSY